MIVRDLEMSFHFVTTVEAVLTSELGEMKGINTPILFYSFAVSNCDPDPPADADELNTSPQRPSPRFRPCQPLPNYPCPQFQIPFRHHSPTGDGPTIACDFHFASQHMFILQNIAFTRVCNSQGDLQGHPRLLMMTLSDIIDGFWTSIGVKTDWQSKRLI